MKNRFKIFGILLTLLAFTTIHSQTVKWEDRMNGDNSVAGLQARGWIVLNEDGGGTTPAWFQGGNYFPAIEGPDTGFVAANFQGANSNNTIDQWLISPALNVSSGDTLFFWMRSPTFNPPQFDDSVNILISNTAGTTPSAFTDLGRFRVPQNAWQNYYLAFSSTGTIRFAIRYYIFDALTYSYYIGLDFFQIVGPGGGGYPTSISINKSFGFTNITSASSYRMIGLPGQTNFAIPVTGTRKTDWNAFYDNGAASNYLVEFDGSANFNFKPGNGFWLLSKNNIAVNVQVNSVPLAGDNTYSIPLHNGWNIISNPFERSTNWSAVQIANGLAGNAVIHDWVGAWSNPAIFTPYKAYYFNNAGGLPSLKIPYDPAGGIGKTSENYFQAEREEDIKLSLAANGEENSKVFIGFDSESSNDFDEHDYFAPPGDFEEARIVIHNEMLSTNYKFLMKETRKEIGEGQIYKFEIKNLTGKELTLNFNGLANYNTYEVYLVDERLNNSLKITDESNIKIPSHVKSTNYGLLIGNQSFIQSNGGNTVPTQFTLFQNYPNPFNPTTTIRYSIPALTPSISLGARVIIKLYDLLGNEVKTILNEVKSPGNYEVELDASEFASGVYVYKMHAGSFTESRKMMLLR